MPKRSTRSSTMPRILRDCRIRRVRVAADGSCWLYAVLACIGKLEHGVEGQLGKKTSLPRPTANDMDMDKKIRAQMAKDERMDDDVLRHPDYEGNRRVDQFLGSFGGPTHYAVLCRLFGLSNIVVWDEVDDSDVMVVTDTSVTFVTPEYAETLLDKLSVHVAHSRETDAHVEAYVMTV